MIGKKDRLIKLYVDELDKHSSFYNDLGSGKYRSFVRRNEAIKKMIQEALKNDKKGRN